MSKPPPASLHPHAAPKPLGVVAALTVLLGACAGQTEGLSTAAVPPAETVSQLPPAVGYQLTPDEMGLSCKKLTGRMAVRIVQIRDFRTRNQATTLARNIQTAVKPAFGGSGEGANPDARYARDRAQLEAYNRRLADQNCANFDLDAELAPTAKEPPRTRPLRKS